MRRILILIVVVILLISVPASASAYSFLGPKWPSVDPVYYWWNYLDYEYGEWEGLEAWWDSVQDWNATPTPVNLAWPGIYGPSQIRLGRAWAPDSGMDGWVIYTYIGDTLLHVDARYNWYYLQYYPQNARRSVTGHELGHALGLGDMPWGSERLMNGFTDSRYGQFGIYTPQPGDIAGINALYN